MATPKVRLESALEPSRGFLSHLGGESSHSSALPQLTVHETALVLKDNDKQAPVLDSSKTAPRQFMVKPAGVCNTFQAVKHSKQQGRGA